jgi:hypothetical protein
MTYPFIASWPGICSESCFDGGGRVHPYEKSSERLHPGVDLADEGEQAYHSKPPHSGPKAVHCTESISFNDEAIEVDGAQICESKNCRLWETISGLLDVRRLMEEPERLDITLTWYRQEGIGKVEMAGRVTDNEFVLSV